MAYNASAMLGLHALIDLNVNYYGWTQDQVADYLKQFFSIDQEQVAEAIYQAVRSNLPIIWPIMVGIARS